MGFRDLAASIAVRLDNSETPEEIAVSLWIDQ
jgi:hypothetical protein